MAGISLRDSGVRVHRWLGLAIGLLAIALALSGTLLACAPLIERIAAPARYRISGETRRDAGAYADTAYRRLRPGERIVFVAAAAPHRRDALDACAYLIDRLKTDAPFWKRETRDGQASWVEARESDAAAAERWQA